MKILIATDMEGATGVVFWDHVQPDHSEYVRYRRLLTGDVNAAIRGAYDGGATEVVVAEGHASARNILIEELDPRGRLNAGVPSPFAQVQGIDDGVDGLIFVGYHARAGTPKAILDHTWSSARVTNLWLNGQNVGEQGLSGGIAGHFNVPVIMLSGDQAACNEARQMFGDVETAATKTGSSRMAAELLPPSETARRISEAAKRAVTRLRAGQVPPPYRLATPITIAIEFFHCDMADRSEIVPGAVRAGPRRIEFTVPDMITAYRCFRSAVTLAV